MPSTTISRGNILLNMLIGPSLTPTALTASTTTAQTFTVPGLKVSDALQVNFAGAQTAGVGIANARVTAADTLEITFSNSTAGTPTPAAGVYIIMVDRAEYLPLPVSAV
jgi:hypothetical protein